MPNAAPFSLSEEMATKLNEQISRREQMLKRTVVDTRTGKRLPKDEFALEPGSGLTNEEVMAKDQAKSDYANLGLNIAGAVGSAAVGVGSSVFTLGLADVAVSKIGRAVAEESTRTKLKNLGIVLEEVPATDEKPAQWKLTRGTAQVVGSPDDFIPKSEKNVGELYVALSGKFSDWSLGQKGLVKQTPEMSLGYDLGQLLGFFSPGKKVAEAAVKGLPKVFGKTGVSLMRPVGGAVTFGTADLMQQLDKKFSEDREIDWKSVGFSTLTGTVFGTVDQVAELFKGRYMLQKALQIDDTPLKMLSKKDQAILAAARQSWQSTVSNAPFSVSQKVWMDVYGDDVGRIFAQTFMNGKATGAYQETGRTLKEALLGPGTTTELATRFTPDTLTEEYIKATAGVESRARLEEMAKRLGAQAEIPFVKPGLMPPKRAFVGTETVKRPVEGVTVYTGSDKPFTKFDTSLIGTRTDAGFAGRGAYTTTSREQAEKWGANVQATTIKGGKWLEISKISDLQKHGFGRVEGVEKLSQEEIKVKHAELANKFAARMSKEGYDGVRWKLSTGDEQYVLFKPEDYTFRPAGEPAFEEYIKAKVSYPSAPSGKAPLVTPPPEQKLIKGKLPKKEGKTNVHPYDEPYHFDPMGVTKLITNKWMVGRVEGFDRLTGSLEAGAIKAEVESRNLNSMVVQILKETNKSAPFGEKVKRLMWSKTTTPIERLFDSLDNYEVPPKAWPKYDQETFLKLRSITKYVLQIQNEARIKAGRSVIKDVGSYISRFRQQLVDNVFIGYNPSESPAVYRMMRNVPADLPDPMARHRTAEKLVEDMFQKDLNKVFPIMINYATRDAYVSDPYRLAMEQANELKNAGIMPPQVYEDFLMYVDKDVLGRQHWLDAGMDKTLGKVLVGPAVKGIANFFGRDIASVTKYLSSTMRWLLIHGAMDLKLRIPLRNMTQQLLDLDFFPLKDVAVAKAQALVGHWPELPDGRNLKDAVEETDWFKLMKEQFTELDKSGWTKLKGLPLAGQKLTQEWNYEQTARVAYIDWLRKATACKDKNSPYYKDVRATAVRDTMRDAYLQQEQYALQRTAKISRQINGEKDEKKRAFLMAQREKAIAKLKSQFSVQEYFEKNFPKKLNNLLVTDKDMLPMIRDAMRLSQFEYFATSMPWMFRSDTARAGLSLQSWWMSFYGSHVREMHYRVMAGRATSGKVLWPGQRRQAMWGWGAMYALGKAVEGLFGVQMVTNILPRPGTRQSPIAETLTGAVDLIYGKVTGDEAAATEGKNKFIHGATLMIPLYGGVKELKEWMEGKQSNRRFFAYPTKAQTKKEKENQKWKD